MDEVVAYLIPFDGLQEVGKSRLVDYPAQVGTAL
jgi:hypothetical protein